MPSAARIQGRWAASLCSPLTWILVVVAFVHVVGIGWGLPASDGWDNDGIAPRDFLAGLVQTFTPGSYFTYPPVHLLLLGVLTLPVTLIALARAPSLAPADVIHEVIKVPYMTAAAFTARGVSLVMSLGIVWALAKMGEELWDRRVGWCIAAVAGVNATLTYYAHTSNLDVPYLFWASLALLALVRSIARHEPRRLRTALVLAVLAVGTKDQAYALFLLAVPAALVSWVLGDDRARKDARAIGRELLLSSGVAAALFLVVDAVVFNPSGFRARLSFLAGAASQEHVEYSADWRGRALVVSDVVLSFPKHYPWVFGLLVLAGIGIVVVRSRGAKRAAALVPLFAACSFTLLFNCVARRTEHRFVLPQMTLFAFYGGVALEPLVFSLRGRIRLALGRAMAAVAFAWALFACADVDANLLLDPRYEAEEWLRANVAPGDTLEVHGWNVYLPRLPAQAHIVRVGPEPVDHRSPLPGVDEKQDAYLDIAARNPRWIVVTGGFVWRYFVDPHAGERSGRVLPPAHAETASDPDATTFFHRLFRGELGYRMTHVSEWKSGLWPALDIHASTARPVYIFERGA